MTEKNYEIKGFALDKEIVSRLDGLAVELYGELWHRSRSVIVNRLIRAARVENGLLVADEREMWAKFVELEQQRLDGAGIQKS